MPLAPCEVPDDAPDVDGVPDDELGGLEVADDELGALDVPDDELGALDMLELPLGLLDMPVVPLELADPAPAARPPSDTPSAASVCASSVPVCGSFCASWNCFTALCVCGPILPSGLPASKPFCVSACCAARMVEASAFDDASLANVDDVDD